MSRYRAISFGLGPIGLSIARTALFRRKEIELIGAVDINPELTGRDLGDLLQLPKSTGIIVSNTAEKLFPEADVVFHATSSFLEIAKSQLIGFCEKGIDVVSTTEELSYPWFHHEAEARELDECAKRNNATILGTGVNPGFVLDALAITLSGACVSVSEIRGERILDALNRRLPFQKKVGIGLTVAEFDQKVRTGKFGHVGLPESIAMVGDALGARVEKIEQKTMPKISLTDLKTADFGVVSAGNVLGLVQDAVGIYKGRKTISYHIEMYAGAVNPHDKIEIIASPNISLSIPGGTPGDAATGAIVVNSVSRVVDSRPGLVTVKDLKPASSFFDFISD